jgi:rhamnosyltransferase
MEAGPPGTNSLDPATARGATVCAVVVTYNPDPTTLPQVLTAAAAQVDGLVIVDNGSRPEGRAAIQAWVGSYQRAEGSHAEVTIRYFPDNRGLPRAFNEAIEVARGAGHRFVLLLDHDSILEPGAVEALRTEFAHLSEQYPVGALEAINVEPVVLSTDDFLEGYFRRRGWGADRGITDDFLATNSGLFFPVTLPVQIGGFDATYFLDAVDFEFGLRARSRGLRIFRIPGARIRHRRGEVDVTGTTPAKGWLIRPVNPIRHYYVARDVLRTFRKYGRRFPLIGLLLLSMPLREGVIVLLFYPRRGPHIRSLLRGTLDALRGVSGPMAT